MTNFDLIFNNAGGITLQAAEYCHHFHGREKEAAQCVSELLEPGAMPECWDSNEPEHRLAYDNEAERRGEYQWVTDNDVLEATGALEKESRESWLEALGDNAMRDFYRELFALSDQRALQQ